MKTKSKAVIAMLALGASAWVIIAQDNGGPQSGQRPPRRPNMDNQGGPGGPGMRGRRQIPPVVEVLDANHDGVVDADEIANASSALKKLDRNGDGKLTMDELMPPPPPQGMDGAGNGEQGNGPRGRPPGRGGPGGQGGPGGPGFDRPPGPPPGDQ